MKNKLNQIKKIDKGKLTKRITSFFLSMLIAVGTFIGGFATMITEALAYDVTATGQLKLASGVCYNGANPNHPFQYSTENMAINSNTYVPAYKRGNDGAGGNIGGSTDILLKRINTGEAWSSVPLYRISRSGGYSDDLPYVTGDTTDLVSSADIQWAANSLSGINRQINTEEAKMIQSVLVNGFKAGMECQDFKNYSWSDNMRYLATQIIIWEIQEGKRTGFGWEDYANPGTNNMVGGNGDWGVRYWKGYWDQLAYPSCGAGITNWYYQILNACRASNNNLNVTSGNTGVTTTASRNQNNANTLNASYINDGRYQMSFFLANSDLWGSQYGQYDQNCIEWIPDAGSRNAQLSWGGNVGYLTTGWERPDEPITGYLKFTQKASNNAFNDVGYMNGSTSNSWRGFLYGGNSTATSLYIRVGSTGGPQPITVRFVDENGTAVNCDWSFNTNGIGEQFTEKSNSKTFTPKYFVDNHTQANYIIHLNSVPTKYEMPSLNETIFFYNGGQALKHGTGPGCVGWGSWDYGACRANFDGNTITITLKSKPQTPVKVKFVDNDTGYPVAVDFISLQKTGLISYSEAFRVTNKSSHTWTPTAKKKQQLNVTVPEGYNRCPTVTFSYEYGFPTGVSGGNVKQLSDGTIEVRLSKATTFNDITVEIRNGATGELLSKTPGVSTVAGVIKEPDGMGYVFYGDKTYRPEDSGVFTVSGAYIYNGSGSNENIPIPESKFEYDGLHVYPSTANENLNMEASGQTVTVYVYLDGTTIRNSMNLKFEDGITGEPVVVDWMIYEENLPPAWGYSPDTTETSSAASFIPQWYLDNRQTASYCLYLNSIGWSFEGPSDYIMPYSRETKFVYDENGRLLNVNSAGDNILSNAEFDEASNSLTIKLYKEEGAGPMGIRVLDGDTGQLLTVTGKLLTLPPDTQTPFTEFEGNFSFKILIPQTFLTYKTDTTCLFSLDSVPEGYDMPATNTSLLNYGANGKLTWWSGGDTNNAELDEATNTLTIKLYQTRTEIEPDLDIEYVQPNADYKIGSSIIATFYLTNNAAIDYNPDSKTLDLEVTLSTKNGMVNKKVATGTTSNIVVPANQTQVVYVKLNIPNDVMYVADNLLFAMNVKCENQIVESAGCATNDGTGTYQTKIIEPERKLMAEPKFQLKSTPGYRYISKPELKEYHNVGRWEEWVYNAGKYTKTKFYTKFSVPGATVKPGPRNPNNWLVEKKLNPDGSYNRYFATRSGYSVRVDMDALVGTSSKYEEKGYIRQQDPNAFTYAQFANLYYPENNYGKIKPPNGGDYYDTVAYSSHELWDDGLVRKSSFEGTEHFTPMWTKDGNYVVQSVLTDCWSPAGMLTYSFNTESMTIEGSMYDDYYFVS